MARIQILLSALLIAACQSPPAPAPLTADEAEACGFYAELIRARFGPATRGVPVNVYARPGAALFLRWPEAPGLDEEIKAELERGRSQGPVVEHVRCDWRALGLPGGRTAQAGGRVSLHVTQPSYAADRTWALVTLWQSPRGTTCLFRRDTDAWTRVGCEESHRIILMRDPARGTGFG